MTSDPTNPQHGFSVTTDPDEPTVRRRFAALPAVSRKDAEAARFTRLVGFTNHVYRVDLSAGPLCLRLPGAGAAALVDRRAEEQNARAAAEAGVAPEILYFGEDGTMLTCFVGSGTPVTPAHLEAVPDALPRSARALRRLHDTAGVFVGSFDAFTFIDSYRTVLDRLDAALSDFQRRSIDAIAPIQAALAARAVPQRPSHCDPTGRNLLDTGEKVWLVDWEYSAMNDPMWDLAYFSIESKLDAGGDRALVEAYFKGAVPQVEVARMAVLKPVVEIVTGLWALIQLGEGNASGDFRSYAEKSFLSAAERIRGPEFKEQIGDLRSD